jgi:hypothetical protein
LTCGGQFQSVRKPSKLRRNLWNEYVWGRQSLGQLAKKTGRSHVWIKHQLEQAMPNHSIIAPTTTVVAADVTFWGRGYGVCVFRSPTLKRNLWYKEVVTETAAVYAEGYASLKQQGYQLQGIVLDGKRGVARVFDDIPVQICQFHQVKTVIKYLTRKPKTDAGRELREIALRLTKSKESEFTGLLADWHLRWKSLLAERTLYPNCTPKRWEYTHRKLMAAYRSLTTNIPFLFTYKRYPEFTLPNTTNCLDGMFSQLKNRLNVHRGAKQQFRYKLIREILMGKG